jgi:hypothetical protein
MVTCHGFKEFASLVGNPICRLEWQGETQAFKTTLKFIMRLVIRRYGQNEGKVKTWVKRQTGSLLAIKR